MKNSKPYKRILVDFAALAMEFIPHARLLTDRPMDLLNAWPPGEPRFAKVAGVSASSLWRKVKKAGAKHFAEMPTNVWAAGLLAECWKLAPVVTVVSGPPYYPQSVNGRRQWVAKHCGSRVRYVAMNEKQRLIDGPGVVLIDPSEVACKFFTEAGGQAILLPLHSNSLHAIADPLSHVIEQLKSSTLPA